jgi:hypothetical protein
MSKTSLCFAALDQGDSGVTDAGALRHHGTGGCMMGGCQAHRDRERRCDHSQPVHLIFVDSHV